MNGRLVSTGFFTAASLALCTQCAIAGPHRVFLALEPNYTLCLSRPPSCSSVGRTSIALEYKPFVTKRLDVRFKLSRGYVQSTTEGIDESSTLSQSQGFQSAADSLTVRVRLFDDVGFERWEPRVGYTYQYSAGTSPAYHGLYASDAWFFGRRILRGTEAPARQFRLFAKISENNYQSNDLPQTFLQVGPTATFPFDATGSWRAEATYTLQRQFAGAGTRKQPSNGLSAGVTHDFSAAVQAYARFEATASSDSVVTGVKLTL